MLQVIWLFAQLLIFALPANAGDCGCAPCPKACPNGLDQVSVILEAQEAALVGNWQLHNACQREAEKFAVDVNKLERLYISTGSEITSALHTLARECKQVVKLMICGHGAPGGIVLTKKKNFSVTDLNDLNGGSCAMAPNAKIYVNGCNSGEGCRGQDFMAGIAARLLSRGGGSIDAYTSLHVTSWVSGAIGQFGTRRTLSVSSEDVGTPKTGPVQMATKPVWSDGTTESISQCRQELGGLMAKIKADEQRLSKCQLSQKTTEAIASTKELLLEADKLQSALEPGSRVRFNGSGHSAGSKFFEAAEAGEALSERLGQIPTCDAEGLPKAPAGQKKNVY